jgi:methylmalonyl-CoA mutase cobalamin-binding domain/chain
VLVLVANESASDRFARRMAASLEELGVETVYLGREERPEQIAAVVVEERADAVELCFACGRGVLLLRQLLRELIRRGRRDVSIVVHRVP